jgi:hypothetical protein
MNSNPAASACSGSKKREIDATNRASAARSTSSSRPNVWITLATGTPRSLCASAT